MQQQQQQPMQQQQQQSMQQQQQQQGATFMGGRSQQTWNTLFIGGLPCEWSTDQVGARAPGRGRQAGTFTRPRHARWADTRMCVHAHACCCVASAHSAWSCCGCTATSSTSS
jgi:hypothetical protein